MKARPRLPGRRMRGLALLFTLIALAVMLAGALSLIRALDAVDGRKLAATDATDGGLHGFCDRLQSGLGLLSEAIADTYFRAAHTQSLTQAQFQLA